MKVKELLNLCDGIQIVRIYGEEHGVEGTVEGLLAMLSNNVLEKNAKSIESSYRIREDLINVNNAGTRRIASIMLVEVDI